MKILKYVVIVENIFGRRSKNTYYPKTNEEYWNQTQNIIDSNTIRFYIKSIDDDNAMEEIWRDFTDIEIRSLESQTKQVSKE